MSALRVLTLNLWNTDGPWPRRARRIGEWIDRLDPDLLAFQEVVRMEGCDQLAELLAGRDYHCDSVAASPFWRLDQGFLRERQVRAVCALVLRRAPRGGFPPLLAGDFNAEPEATEIRYLTGLHPLDGHSVCLLDAWARIGDGGPGFTWSNANPWARRTCEPDRRIDYVFSGLPRRDGLGEPLDCRVVCNDEVDGVWPSDHFGVYAELRSEARAE